MFFTSKGDINWDFVHCGEFARLFVFCDHQKFVWDDAFFLYILILMLTISSQSKNFLNGLHMVSKGF